MVGPPLREREGRGPDSALNRYLNRMSEPILNRSDQHSIDMRGSGIGSVVDHAELFRQHPAIARHVYQGWAWQFHRREPFRWWEIGVLHRALEQYARLGLVRVAPNTYRFVDERLVLDRVVTRLHGTKGVTDIAMRTMELYQHLERHVGTRLERGTLSRRVSGFAVTEGDPLADRVTRFLEGFVESGMLVRESGFFLTNLDRDPDLQEQLDQFIHVELPAMAARSREAEAAIAQREAAIAQREAAARERERQERERQAESRRTWKSGSIREVADRFGVNDAVLAHLIRRGFSHHEISRVLHVGMSRLTRIRKDLGLTQ